MLTVEQWEARPAWLKSFYRKAAHLQVYKQMCDVNGRGTFNVEIDGRRNNKFRQIIQEDDIFQLAATDQADESHVKLNFSDLRPLTNLMTYVLPTYKKVEDDDAARAIVDFFSQRIWRNDVSGSVNQFATGHFNDSHRIALYLNSGNQYATLVGNQYFIIPKEYYDHAIARLKEKDLYNARRDVDNLSAYLKSKGISDPERIIYVLSQDNKRDSYDDMFEDSDTPKLRSGSSRRPKKLNVKTLFSNMNEQNIRKEITIIGHKLADLDKDLTILRYVDMRVKEAGGVDVLKDDYEQEVTALVDKIYCKSSGNIKHF